MAIDVRERIKTEIVDYQSMVETLRELAYPRNKINDLIRQRKLIRVKKGLYVFGDKHRRHPYSRELLANLIYGPSYVSMDYALAHHGLIPERVEALSSVTPNRSRRFSTPVGLFLYRQVPARAYETGVVRAEGEHGQAFLIATPEKALADKIVSVRGVAIYSIGDMRRFLEEDLRIDAEALRALSAERIDDYAERYRSRRLRFLAGIVRRLRKAGEGSS